MDPKTLESQIREAILTELTRQAELPDSGLEVEPGETRLTVRGTIDLHALSFAIAGSLAGDP